MAVNRVWFPEVPTGSIGVSDRALLGVGYGAVSVALTNPQRVWFPHEPDGTIEAHDRSQIAIGFGRDAGVPPVIPPLDLYKPIFGTSKKTYQMSATKNGYQIKITKEKGQIKWLS